MRRWLISVLLLVLPAVPAAAQVTGPTYVFTNGTVADATQVNSDFAAIYAAALNRAGGTMTGTLTAQQITPAASNTYDTGTSSAFWRSGYFKTSLVLGQTTANYTLTWANPASARAISIEDPGGTDIFVWKAATQTLTNKTLTAPVLSGSVTGTYTLAGTPTIPASGLTGTITSSVQDNITRTGTVASGTWSASFGAVSGANLTSLTAANVTGSHTLPDGVLSTNVPLLNAANTFASSTAGAFSQTVQHSAAGTTNEAALLIANDGNKSLRLDSFSSTWTPSGDTFANGQRLVATGAGGLSISASDAAGVLRLYTAGSLRWGINAAGDWTVGASSHIALSNGTPSVAESGGATSTSGATATGSDLSMVVSGTGIGSGAGANQVTITFGHTYSQKPAVYANASDGGTTNVKVTTVSTTQAIVTFTNRGAGGAYAYEFVLGVIGG